MSQARTTSARPSAAASSRADGASNTAFPNSPWSTLDSESPPPNRPSRTPFRFRRSWIIAAVALIATGIAIALISAGFQSARNWLSAQPEYTLPFHDITLDPAPPAYIRSGRTGLLETVAQSQSLPERLPLLNTPLDEIVRAFALGSPWVNEVRSAKVHDHPPRLTVALDYRRPTVYLSGPRQTRVVLDDHAVVLPNEDLDLARIDQLIQLSGWSGPFAGRPGSTLSADNPDADRALQAACRLAAFFQDQPVADPQDQSAKHVTVIDIRHGSQRLLASIDSGTWVLWGDSPGDESPGTLTAGEKWTQLTDWFHQNPATPADPRALLVFGPKGLTLRTAPTSTGSPPP